MRRTKFPQKQQQKPKHQTNIKISGKLFLNIETPIHFPILSAPHSAILCVSTHKISLMN